MALITKGKSHAKGEYASMDLTSVVGTLESHWVVLDAELAEIKKDIASLRSLTRKYGEYWNRSLGTLKKLRVQKENLLKEIKFQMELFNLHIQQARAPAPPRLHKNCACAVPPLSWPLASTGSSEGMIISRIAALVTMSTRTGNGRPISAFARLVKVASSSFVTAATKS